MTHADLVAAGYDVDAAAHARLQKFIHALLEENRRLNLTAIRDEHEAWVAHVCDSLSLLPLMRAARLRALLDLGTGGGLPGVPLACVCPAVQVTVLDATRKKLAAVERIVATVGLDNVSFVWGRAEALAHDPAYREQFDAASARAVAELRILVEYAAGFVRPGGVAWFFKTRLGLDDEIGEASAAARTCALELVETHPYCLPGTDVERVILDYRKRGPLPSDLPRRAGRPRKRPL